MHFFLQTAGFEPLADPPLQRLKHWHKAWQDAIHCDFNLNITSWCCWQQESRLTKQHNVGKLRKVQLLLMVMSWRQSSHHVILSPHYCSDQGLPDYIGYTVTLLICQRSVLWSKFNIPRISFSYLVSLTLTNAVSLSGHMKLVISSVS